jgi:hypothetical protein
MIMIEREYSNIHIVSRQPTLRIDSGMMRGDMITVPAITIKPQRSNGFDIFELYDVNYPVGKPRALFEFMQPPIRKPEVKRLDTEL